MVPMSCPSKYICPSVGSSNLNKSLPVVDFPLPDSPTSPNVSPRNTLKSIPFTALTVPSGILSTLLFMINSFLKFFTSIISTHLLKSLSVIRCGVIVKVSTMSCPISSNLSTSRFSSESNWVLIPPMFALPTPMLVDAFSLR